MIKRFLTYMAGLLLLAGCSDDFEPRTPGSLDEDGLLHLSFGVMPAYTVTTRSDALPTVDMYVYDNSGLLQQASLTLDADNKASIFLNKEVMNAGNNAKFYFVGNAPQTLSKPQYSSMGSIEGATFTDVKNNSDALLTLSSIVDYADITSTIPLYHNGVMVTVNNAVENFEAGKDDPYYTPGEMKYPFVVRGTATASPAVAGALGQDSQKSSADYCGNPDASNLPADLVQGEQYVHPTRNSGQGFERQSYIIVQAEYLGKNYFYRLDFQTIENQTTKGFDLLPHHHYQVLILGISGTGYDSIEDAALNPAPMVKYEIHDHAPVIYNMISDGTRELGVAKDVTFQDVDFDNNSHTTEVMKVKLYTKTESEYNYFTNPQNWGNIFQIPSNCDWLAVDKIEKSNDDSDYGSGTDTDKPDWNNRGIIYNVSLKVNKTNNPGNLETEMIVNWLGLTRPVKVYWTRNFDASTLFSPVVAIRAWEGKKDNWNTDGRKFESNDYFGEFLTNSTVGTLAKANNGSNRADGLHFPMPYGEGTKWTYMYKLTINPAVGSDSNFTWDVTTSGVSNITVIKPSNRNSDNEDNRTFYITRSADDFNYETGKLILTITQNGKTVTYDNIKLYHTGFFHKDDSNSGPNNSSDNSGYSNNQNYLKSGTSVNTQRTYYEVVKIGNNYWLDRNMGAKSAEMAIKDGNSGVIGNEDALGYYMVGGHYWIYNKPIIYKNSVPPGYQVPTASQWTDLKTAGNFNVEQVGSYYYPTARIGEKTVYFPKGQYYEGNTLLGESRAGYYWTSDAASGTEKQEVGKWLKCMQFTGAATSFVNGRDNTGGSDVYYMAMRACYGTADARPQEFYFKVKGATHVYLYREDNGIRTAATTWPGQAIGNYTTASEEFEFNYATATPSDWKVIFNFVDQEGKIHTYSKNDFDGILTSHTNIRPAEAQGWPVWGSNKSSDFSKTDCGVNIDNATSENGTLWTVSSPVPKTKFEAGDQILVRWPKDFRSHIWIWGNPATVNYTGGNWPGKSGDINGDYREYKFTVTQTEAVINYQFNNGSDSGKTENFSFTCNSKYWDSSRNMYVYTMKNDGNVDPSILPDNSGDNPTVKKYRLLWSRHGNYFKVKLTFSQGGTSTSTYVTPNVSYEQTYKGTKYFCYDFQPTSDDFKVKLEFEDNNGDHTTASGNPEYTAASFKETISGTNGGMVISNYAYGNIVYFEKSSWSGEPYAYCWSGSTKNKDWPGIKIKKMSGNIYKYETTNDWENIIFNNNNATQTNNLIFYNKNLYKEDGTNVAYAP